MLTPYRPLQCTLPACASPSKCRARTWSFPIADEASLANALPVRLSARLQLVARDDRVDPYGHAGVAPPKYEKSTKNRGGKLRPSKNADQRRELYLDRAQRLNFIEKSPADLAVFLRGLCQLPLRPGAFAKLKAGDFDKRLQVLKIGRDKSGKDRRIKLPDVTAALVHAAANGKLPTAPLLSRADGKAWNKVAFKWPIKTTVGAANLPSNTTAYTLRHSVISDLVHNGLDLLTVAQISGISVAMIERHYGHLRSDVAAVALARLVL